MSNDSKCIFVINKEGNAPFKVIHEHVKDLGGFYNGAGWFVEAKHAEFINTLCSGNEQLSSFQFPLEGTTFDELKRSHKINFFRGKVFENGRQITALKYQLDIQEDDLETILEGERRSYLEGLESGQKLIKLLEENKALQEQIKRKEEEERISKLSSKVTYDFPAYTLEDLQRELNQAKEGLRTGYKELDEYVRIPNSAITLIAGRPSHGKTSFMLNLFMNMVRNYSDECFYFFSFEETRQQIAVKLINILSGFVFEEAKNLIQLEGYIKSGTNNLKQVEQGKAEYQELVNSGRLRIVSETYSVQHIPAIVSFLKSKYPIGAIFIDYIQKIKNEARFGTRQLELADTSDIILNTAKAYSIPIVLGAQLGRDTSSRDKVKLDNLREAGDLEQDANLVLGIFNPSMEKANEEQKQLTDRKIDLRVTPLKNRNGLVNKNILLEFDRPVLRISDKQK